MGSDPRWLRGHRPQYCLYGGRRQTPFSPPLFPPQFASCPSLGLRVAFKRIEPDIFYNILTLRFENPIHQVFDIARGRACSVPVEEAAQRVFIAKRVLHWWCSWL